MNTLIRPALYDSYHHIYVNKKENSPRQLYGVCGQICENTDYWCKERELPSSIAENDIIVVNNAGAYGFAMSFEYNGRMRPAEVLISGNKSTLIRKRETFNDIIKNIELSEAMRKSILDLSL
jgi:diaminopimelate decarboxylase